ncbi:MAG: DUF1015 domain-containing protein [Coriobacteriia bacterium]|nr:DUF1015 domain-containing protein [Coriobacteriia bacterium]
MAVVRPFRAVRYARPEGFDITPLTAPPYDVIPAELREDLLGRDPHNVVALELPEGALDPSAPGNRYETARTRWRSWLEEGILGVEGDPVIYVLEQRYPHQGTEIARRGFIAAVDLEPFSAGVVLPHERTLPKAIDDRLNMTRATAANLSQVFSMYDDPEHVTDAFIARAMATPALATATDDDGVVSTIWALTDPADHMALAAFMADRPVFIADGHHRYTTALAYRDERRAAEADLPKDVTPPAYDSVMMALVNMDDPGLVVWPTHRIADAPGHFDPQEFRTALAEHFDVLDVPEGHPSKTLAANADLPSFLVATRDGVTKLVRLRSDIDHTAAYPTGTSAPWRALDVATLQELILNPLLDIHPDRPETLDRLSFAKDAHKAMKAAGDHDAVFILNPTRMDQVAAVALAGETMPQKSTYFYPKLLSGLLFKSLA